MSEALSSEDKDKWVQAMHDELASLEKKNVWTLTDLLPGKKLIQNKWVFKIKRDSETKDGNVTKFKARLIAKGFTQKYGIDYCETFSPIVSSTLRILFSMAVEFDWEIDHWDVTTAFLYGDLKEEVYMHQPEGMLTPEKENKVCRLNKSLYGLKQSSPVWYQKLDVELKLFGFKQSNHETCIYVKSKNKCILIVAVFVDDIFLFGNDCRGKKKLKINLMNKFKLKDLGNARHVLGIGVKREKDEIRLDQSRYISYVLDKFRMTDCKPVTTPLEAGSKLQNGKCEIDFPYQSLIGCLMYITINARPDIAHSISFLSQFNSCYNEEHVKSAKRVLRYLKGTINEYLLFKKSNKAKSDPVINGYMDANWRNDVSDRRSYTGYVFKLNENLVS